MIRLQLPLIPALPLRVPHLNSARHLRSAPIVYAALNPWKGPICQYVCSPKVALLQINGVYQAGQEGGELFFFPPCVLSESPAIFLALQMKMTGRLCWDGRQDLVHGSPTGLHCILGMMSPLHPLALLGGPPGRLSHLTKKAQQSWGEGSAGKVHTGQV